MSAQTAGLTRDRPAKYQATVWTHPDERVITQWGPICYGHWLELERRRWADKNFRNAWVEMKEGGEGLVALFTDDPEMIDAGEES